MNKVLAALVLEMRAAAVSQSILSGQVAPNVVSYLQRVVRDLRRRADELLDEGLAG